MSILPLYYYFGIPIFISHDHPKLRIRSDFEWITEEQRTKTDTWLLETFGYTEILRDGVVIKDEKNNRLYMNPRTFEKVKHELSKYPCLS